MRTFIRSRIFRQTRLPGQLPKALQVFKARFIHGGNGVEEYLRREPYLEWTSAFVKVIRHALHSMEQAHALNDEQDSLVKLHSEPPDHRQC